MLNPGRKEPPRNVHSGRSDDIDNLHYARQPSSLAIRFIWAMNLSLGLRRFISGSVVAAQRYICSRAP